MQRHVLELAIVRSMTYRYWLTTLLNSFCHSISSPSAGFLNGVGDAAPDISLVCEGVRLVAVMVQVDGPVGDLDMPWRRGSLREADRRGITGSRRARTRRVLVASLLVLARPQVHGPGEACGRLGSRRPPIGPRTTARRSPAQSSCS